jgi:hypothetical protein
VSVFVPNLSKLPPSQLKLWPELGVTPESFTLYGGTALTLRLGHRTSVDFAFFSNKPVDPERLVGNLALSQRRGARPRCAGHAYVSRSS